MESKLREHEKRTLSAHLECKSVCVCVLVLVSQREANVEPFHRTSRWKNKEAILGLTVRPGITVTLAHFVVLIRVYGKQICQPRSKMQPLLHFRPQICVKRVSACVGS